MKQPNHALIPSGTFQLPPAFGGIAPTGLAELRPVIHSVFGAWLNKTEAMATRRAYRTDVEQFLAVNGLDRNHVEQMTRMVPDDGSRWRDHLLQCGGRINEFGERLRATNATVARKMTALRSFFSYLQVHGYRGASPAHPDFVTAPKMPVERLTPGIPP